MENDILPLLPPPIAAAVEEAIKRAQGTPSELHLRAGNLSSLTVRASMGEENLLLPFCLSDAEMREILSHVCQGSIYAFEESIREGFVSLPSGVRVGVAGRAAHRDGKILSLSHVRSLCFRIPHAVPFAANGILSLFRRKRRGILAFGAPGAGKTTLLRELAREISRGENALRCAVIDTRGEFFGFERECLIDLLSGYPKALGAQIAVRTLSPELLIMDELGKEDIEALLSLSSLGVPVVASVHGTSADEVKGSAALPLLTRGIFSYLWDVRGGCSLPIREKG